MRETEADLTARLDEAVDMPPGEGQVAAILEIVRHAEAAGYASLQLDARLELVDAYIQADAYEVAEVNVVIAAFTRCLSLYNSDPARFTDEHLESLWRQFAVIGIVMVSLPDYPLAQVRAVFDDMERRCRPDRFDLHTIYTLRVLLAGQLGDHEELDRCRQRLLSLDVAEYACPACLAMLPVRELIWQGRDEDAIAQAEPILRGDLPCDTDNQPRDTLAALLLPYLHVGRLGEARDAFRYSYRLFDEGDEELASYTAFCALTGNEDRGLEIFAKHLNQFDVIAPKSLGELMLQAATALLFERLIALGRGEEIFVWPADPDDPEDYEEEWTFAALAEEYRKDALAMAARFDERNGNTHTSDRIRGTITAQPIVEHLPLSPLAAAIQTRATEAAGGSGATHAAGGTADADPAAGTARSPETQQAFDTGRIHLAEMHQERGEQALEAGRIVDAIEDLIEAVAAYTALGDPRAAIAQVRLATAYLSADRMLDAAECAEQALLGLTGPADEGHPPLQARWVLVQAYPALGQPMDALTMIDEMLDRDKHPDSVARLHREAGDILVGLDEDGAAAERYASAGDAYARAKNAFGEAECRRLTAVALAYADEGEAAVDLLSEVRRLVDQLPGDSRRTAWERAILDYDSARVLAASGRREEAIRRAELSAKAFLMLDDEEQTDKAQYLLAQLREPDGEE